MGKKMKKQKEKESNKNKKSMNLSSLTRLTKQKITLKNKQNLPKANASIIFKINENFLNQNELEKQYYKRYLYFIKEEFNHKVIIMFFNYISSTTIIPIPFKNNRYFIKDFLKIIIDLLMNEIDFVTVTLLFDALGWIREGSDPWIYIYYICLYAKKKSSSNDIFSKLLEILDKNNKGFKDSYNNWENNIKNKDTIGVNEANKRFRELMKPIYLNEEHQKYIDYNEIVDKILSMSNKKENAQFHKDNESNQNKKDIIKDQKNKNNPPMPLEPRPMRSGLNNNESQSDDNRQDRQPSMLDFKRENSNSFFGSRYLDLSREGSRNNSFFFNFDGELNKFNSKPNM